MNIMGEFIKTIYLLECEIGIIEKMISDFKNDIQKMREAENDINAEIKTEDSENIYKETNKLIDLLEKKKEDIEETISSFQEILIQDYYELYGDIPE